jgi:phosphoglycerate dehydrogenase-like enzyme
VKRWAIALAAVLAGVPCLYAQNKKIVVVGLSPQEIREIQLHEPGATIVAATRERLLSEVVDADALLGTVSPALIRAGKKLKWVQSYSAGVENYLTPELKASDIILTNAKIIQGPEIADHAMALLLALTRGMNVAIGGRGLRAGDRNAYPLIELNGKTAVIIGVGGIGMQIAVRAHAFGMTIIGVDPKDIPYTPVLSRVVPPDRLEEVLPLADVVFVSAPHTPQTEGMLSERQFSLMKTGSYFVAVSRGRLYSSEALVKALETRRLAGAGLDVTNPEPLPKEHPLRKFDNVIITPHVAGHSDLIQRRLLELIKENVRRFVTGKPLLNIVDKEKGY